MAFVDGKVWNRNTVIKTIGLIASVIGIFSFVTGIFSLREAKYKLITLPQKKSPALVADTLSVPDQSPDPAVKKSFKRTPKNSEMSSLDREEKQVNFETDNNYPIHINNGDTIKTELTVSNIIKELSMIKASEPLRKVLANQREKGILLLGERKQSFFTDKNLYVFLLDNTNVYGVFKFLNGRYYSLLTDEILSNLAPPSRGEYEIWVQDHSEK